VLGRPSTDQTEYFPARATLGKKKKKKKKKKQNSETLNPHPVKSFSIPHYTEKAGGLQNCQTPVPNLPKRRRQIGLDAKGVNTRTTKTEILPFLNWEFYSFSFFFFISFL
jgi:hypothetical protein